MRRATCRYDEDRKFIREIGKNLYARSFAHTVKIDPKDNVWVTDKGSDMAIKFDPDGRVQMACPSENTLYLAELLTGACRS